MKIKTAALWADTHIFHEDQKAVKLWMKILEACPTLKEIILLGDFADFKSVSSHDKKADHHVLLAKEVDSVNAYLDLIDKTFPRLEKTFIEGNHCDRLNRYMNKKAPELFGITDCETLFKINERNKWKWVGYGPDQYYRIFNSRGYCRHKPTRSSLKPSLDRLGADIGTLYCGHTHSFQSCTKGLLKGGVQEIRTCGFLGKIKDESGVFDYTELPNWELGSTLVHVTSCGKHFTEDVKIKKSGKHYFAYAMGRLFKV